MEHPGVGNLGPTGQAALPWDSSVTPACTDLRMPLCGCPPYPLRAPSSVSTSSARPGCLQAHTVRLSRYGLVSKGQMAQSPHVKPHLLGQESCPSPDSQQPRILVVLTSMTSLYPWASSPGVPWWEEVAPATPKSEALSFLHESVSPGSEPSPHHHLLPALLVCALSKFLLCVGFNFPHCEMEISIGSQV